MFKIIEKNEIKIKEHKFSAPVDSLLLTLSNDEHYIQKSWGHDAGGRFFNFVQISDSEFQEALSESLYVFPDLSSEVRNKVSRKHFSVSYSDLNHNKVNNICGFSTV
jgi:hypothetical protein